MIIHHSSCLWYDYLTDVIHVGTSQDFRDSWRDESADRLKTRRSDWNLRAGNQRVDTWCFFSLCLSVKIYPSSCVIVCICVFKCFSPRGHCLWVQTAPTQVLSVASLICRNYVSQQALSVTHIHQPPVSLTLSLLFPLFFFSFPCLFFRALVASGWLAVCVCVCECICNSCDGLYFSVLSLCILSFFTISFSK